MVVSKAFIGFPRGGSATVTYRKAQLAPTSPGGQTAATGWSRPSSRVSCFVESGFALAGELMIEAVIWDFGGGITVFPFEGFWPFETENGATPDIIPRPQAPHPSESP